MWFIIMGRANYFVVQMYFAPLFSLNATIMPYSISLIIISFLLLGCGGATHRGDSDEQPDTLYINRYSNRFQILGQGDTMIIKVLDPWQGASEKEFEYRITKPLERVVCMSSSHVGFLEALGQAQDRVVGVSGLKFLTNRAIKATDVGYDNNINYELLVGLKPDMVLVYEVSGENSSTVQKMRQLGLNVMYVADYLESSPLGRAEWILFFGAITGHMEQASDLFQAIEQNYTTTCQRVDSLLKTGAQSPRVMLNSPYRDVWYAPGDRSYMVQLINDAGASYLAAGQDNDTSRPIAIEVAYNLMCRADVWLNPASDSTIEQLNINNPRFKNLEVVQQKMVYNNNLRSTPNGGSDFWESGPVRPDIVLMDMVKIFHPSIMADHQFYYHRKLE